MPEKTPKRLHRATFARDKRKGGYIIRVEGPTAESFAGREIPVTMKDGKERMEKVDALLWMGVDQRNGSKVALYSFTQKPRDKSAGQIEF